MAIASVNPHRGDETYMPECCLHSTAFSLRMLNLRFPHVSATNATGCIRSGTHVQQILYRHLRQAPGFYSRLKNVSTVSRFKPHQALTRLRLPLRCDEYREVVHRELYVQSVVRLVFGELWSDKSIQDLRNEIDQQIHDGTVNMNPSHCEQWLSPVLKYLKKISLLVVLRES